MTQRNKATQQISSSLDGEAPPEDRGMESGKSKHVLKQA